MSQNDTCTGVKDRLAYYVIAAIVTGITLAAGSRSPAWSVEVGIVLVAIISIVVVAVDLKGQHLHAETDQ